jgi:hypothetical protein
MEEQPGLVLKEKTSTGKILKTLKQYFASREVDFIVTSQFINGDDLEKDIDLCLPANLAGQDLIDLQEFKDKKTQQKLDIRWEQVMNSDNQACSQLDPSPYQVYDSAGIATAAINGRKVDFMAGYALKIWEANKPAEDQINRVDFSLAIGKKDFCQYQDGIAFLSLPLQLLKYYLEIRYIGESEIEQLESNGIYNWKSIKRSCIENIITGLERLRREGLQNSNSIQVQKAFAPAKDFLDLQVENHYISHQAEADVLYNQFLAFCNHIE